VFWREAFASGWNCSRCSTRLAKIFPTFFFVFLVFFGFPGRFAKHHVQRRLRSTVKVVSFRGGRLKIVLEGVSCRPEFRGWRRDIFVALLWRRIRQSERVPTIEERAKSHGPGLIGCESVVAEV